MGCVTEIQTIHDTGGRVRLLVPLIKWSPNNTAALKSMLAELRGVYHFKACVHVGSVLVYFDRRKLSKEALVAAIHNCPFPEDDTQKPTVPPPLHAKQHEHGIKHSHGFKKGGAHTHYLLFDLVKHGLMAGSPMSGHVSLAFAGVMAVRMVKRRVKRKHTEK